MAYDSEARWLALGSFNFGSSNKTFIMPPAPGKTWQYLDIVANVTTTCAGGTTTPIIQVGKSGDTDFLALLNLGTAAGGTSIRQTTDAPASRLLTSGCLDTDADLHIVLVAATGGGAAGVADVFVLVREI
jgi:hypothetical protein